MAETTHISWADHTHNHWLGCTKISNGPQGACEGCYAKVLVEDRFGRAEFGGPGKGVGTRALTSEANRRKPFAWDRKAAKDGTRPFVFCSSLADVFDSDVPPAWRADLFDTIRRTPNLVWLLLTKRPSNIVKLYKAIAGLEDQGEPASYGWPPNAAIGCTVVTQAEADRDIPKLLAAKAALKPAFAFLSMEPLMGPVDVSRYLGDNWNHGDQQEQRGVRLSGGDLRGPGDHAGWDDLEGPQAGLGSLETGGGQPPVQESEGRATSGEGRLLFPGGLDAGRQEGLRFGAPSGVPALKGTNPGWNDGQSQGRQEEAKTAGQPGTSDLFGAASPRKSGSRDGVRGKSERRGQPPSDSDRGTVRGDQEASRCRGETTADRERLRDRLPDGISDRARGSPFTGIGWAISGGETNQGSHKARPSHPDWFRAIRDQCAPAGVPYHHKQNGEWAPAPDADREMMRMQGGPSGRWHPEFDVFRVGKARAGRTLDGAIHDARPEAHPHD